jgi:hypothetical protein
MKFGDDYEDLGEIDYPSFHKRLEETVFIVHEIMQDKKHFKPVFKELYNYMKQGFEKPEVRKHPLKFKFTTDEHEPIRTMEVRHFIINMIYWHPFMKFDKYDDLNEEHIYDCSCPTTKSSIDYINRKIIHPYRKEIDLAEMNSALDDMVYLLSRINNDFAVIMATTLDMESFIEMREKYPRFKELTETEIPEGMQPKSIEDLLDANLKEFVDIINTDPEPNNIRPLLITGAGINKGQLSQFAINGGLKPDIEGNVIPIPINSSFINKGLNSIANFYIDGQAGSKPLILNKTVMGKSGHFAYKTMTLTSSYRLSHTVHDCHSDRYIKYNVLTQKHLNVVNSRYYLDEATNTLKVIDADVDTHLIGQTILLRDPTTCCAPDGICPICYGDLSYVNNDPAFHAGRFAATKINEPIEQKILSSKHMLATNSNILNFGPGFDRFFVLNSNKIMLNLDSEENFKDWTLGMNTDDYFILDDMNQDGDFNYYTERFFVYNRKTGEVVNIQEEASHDIFFYGEVAQLIKKKDDDIVGVNLAALQEDLPIASINIANNELTTPLKNIMKLLDRVAHLGCTTVDDMVNHMVQLTIDSDITVDAVHCSMILKGLFRRNSDILLEPDWSDPETREDYQILTITHALIFNPSFTVSASFESLAKQVINPNTYRKYTKSDYDFFYTEDLHEASRKYYKKKKKRDRLAKYDKKYRKMVKKDGNPRREGPIQTT